MFMKKYKQSVHQKLGQDPYLILLNSKKYGQCIQETKYFERGLLNFLKISNFIFGPPHLAGKVQ